jgi:hypothetical protein
MFNDSMRSSMTPCGSFVFASAVDTRVYCWNVETGNLVITTNMDLNYMKPPRDIQYHPYDHIIAFASYGPHSPIYLFNYDSDVATKDLTSAKHVKISARSATPNETDLAQSTNEQNYMSDNDIDKYNKEQLNQWKRVQTQLDAVYVRCVSLIKHVSPGPNALKSFSAVQDYLKNPLKSQKQVFFMEVTIKKAFRKTKR